MRRLRFAIDRGWRGGGRGEDAGGRRRGSLHWLYTVAQSGAVRVGPGSDLSETDEVTRNALHPVSLRRGAGGWWRGGADEADKNAGVTGAVSASDHGQRESGGGAIDGVKERSECNPGDENISGPTLQGGRGRVSAPLSVMRAGRERPKKQSCAGSGTPPIITGGDLPLPYAGSRCLAGTRISWCLLSTCR